MRFALSSLFSDLELRGMEPCGDLRAALSALCSLGVRVDQAPGELSLAHPASWVEAASVNAEDSATLVRMLAPMAAAAGTCLKLAGSAQLRRRPMTGLVLSLRSAGVDVRSSPCPTLESEECLPLQTSGRLMGNSLRVIGRESSGHVSGFLMALALMGGGQLQALEVPSISYVMLTGWALRRLGFSFQAELRPAARGWSGTFEVRPNGGPPRVLDVPGDYLLSAFYASSACLTGGEVKLTGLYDPPPFPGDHDVVGLFSQMGASSRFSNGAWIVSCPEPLGERKKDGPPPLEVSFDDFPDMPLSLAPMAALRPLLARGMNRLTTKESDRVTAMREVLSGFGLRVESLSDGLSLAPARLMPFRFTCRDHRVGMMGASLAVAAGGSVGRAECVSKSDPSFWKRLEALGGKVVISDGARLPLEGRCALRPRQGRHRPV
ncbi:MAG: hypothetical protein RAK24_01685 [TACK group archaeon]|nr:hypothetical protein [TACK group archaeon]